MFWMGLITSLFLWPLWTILGYCIIAYSLEISEVCWLKYKGWHRATAPGGEVYYFVTTPFRTLLILLYVTILFSACGLVELFSLLTNKQ